MNVSHFFAADYAEARRKFREHAAAAGARVDAHAMAVRGPDGGALATDVAWLGPDDAASVLVTISGTHGVEGFCGSGVQVATFAAPEALPPDAALVAVHAINPYGFAWLRRVTEENVDLNRNFVDHAGKLPANDDYDALAAAICPERWDAESRAASGAVLAAFGQRHGAHALQKAVSGGQYRHPGGLFYGGAAPSWSRRTLEAIACERLGRARRVAVIDYHTGLGPPGYGEPIVVAPPESAALARARRWWGERVTSTEAGSSSSPTIVGDGVTALERLLAHAQVTGMALEFGTLPLDDVLDALRADAWLHVHGDPASDEGRAVKRQIRDAFFVDTDAWKAQIVEQGIERQRQALRGLVSS